MKIKLVALRIILLFIIPVISFGWITQVCTADGEEQSIQEQKVIDTEFEKYLSTLDPTDNITVIVRLKNDPNVDAQIQAIHEGQSDDESHRIAKTLDQKYRDLSIAVGPFEEQLKAGDPAAVERFNQLLVEYGLTAEYLKATNERLQELGAAKNEQVNSVLEQAYSDMQNMVKNRVEQLPDTTVIDSYFMPNTVVVKTKVDNIKAVAAMPDVIDIFQSARGVTAISPNYGPTPLSPDNGSIACPTYGIPFLWTPFKEATKYRFVLTRDSVMTQIVKEIEVTTTGYVYDGMLDYSTNYFWRVMALEPAPTEWSQTFSFQTELAPPPTEQDPHQTTNWSPVLVVGLVLTIACPLGLITWFLVTVSHRAK
jgi:hypothetical protein